MHRELHPVKRALLSVTNKEGIVAFARSLKELGVEIISTGGTAKLLTESGIAVTPIQNVTGNPEAFGGRMKTISFQVESALLYRRGHQDDEADAKKLGITPIDMVVCNLYAFADAVKNEGTEEDLIENIDIGGPTMIRASAKNYESVACCVNPNRYSEIINELEKNAGKLSFETRRSLAVEAFSLTADYDVMIANELQNRYGDGETAIYLKGHKEELRYGENPHQQAWLLQTSNSNSTGIGQAPVLQGKTLSYNNLLDADAAWKCNSEILNGTGIHDQFAVTIVKHGNPCGIALANNQMKALELAWASDPISAFGGIICFSQKVGGAEAQWLNKKFVEIVIAPEFDQDALDAFGTKKNLRLIVMSPKEKNTEEMTYRSLSGGILVQQEDEHVDWEFQSVTDHAFPVEKFTLAKFGVVACKYLKSNAIALVGEKDGAMVLAGAGMGQPNRLDSLRMLAVPRAKELGFNLSDLIMISDAFFPFADSIEVAHAQHLRFVIQPGGSIKDNEVIEAANKFKMAMAFTGKRHFRH